MPFTTVQFIFIYAAFVLGAVFGWFLWHHKDADFFQCVFWFADFFRLPVLRNHFSALPLDTGSLMWYNKYRN